MQWLLDAVPLEYAEFASRTSRWATSKSSGQAADIENRQWTCSVKTKESLSKLYPSSSLSTRNLLAHAMGGMGEALYINTNGSALVGENKQQHALGLHTHGPEHKYCRGKQQDRETPQTTWRRCFPHREGKRKLEHTCRLSWNLWETPANRRVLLRSRASRHISRSSGAAPIRLLFFFCLSELQQSSEQADISVRSCRAICSDRPRRGRSCDSSSQHLGPRSDGIC